MAQLRSHKLYIEMKIRMISSIASGNYFTVRTNASHGTRKVNVDLYLDIELQQISASVIITLLAAH